MPQDEGFDTIDIAGTPWRSLTLKVADFGNPRLQILTSLAPVEERVNRTRRLDLAARAVRRSR